MGMTIKDIAKKCGVGVSTVSRALNNHPDINPETKKMILKTVEESNFVPCTFKFWKFSDPGYIK